ncbi:MAG: response regulator [Rhodocyclales bacterium]|nr:response regulator [Rhodocyclales bacterium]
MTGAQTFTLLFVDDEANILSSLKRLFRPAGYRILTAGGGEEALALMEREPADVVVSDMRMPGMSGAQVLAEVRRRWPQAQRILLTGYADIASTVEAINAGQIHRYIAKPWDDNEIQLVVREALERKTLQQEKARLEALTRRQNEELKALNAGLEAKVAARTAELAAAHEKLKTGFINTIRTFSNLMELRGGQMAGHSRRVAEQARRISQALQLPAPEAQDLFFAALLHDIGKIGFADALLAKPFNQLTPDERNEVVKHPTKAEALLMGLEQLQGAARLIRSHHERFDGQGFPDQISGMAIPLGARILAVANDYDAVQQGAIFAKRATPEEALEYLHAGRGKRYDPAVLDAFEAVLGGPAKSEGAGRALDSERLKAGMVLAKDLVTREGVLLLAHSYLLDENIIKQIRSFERTEGYSLTIHVMDNKP